MNIFDKRPLALIIFCMLSGFVVFTLGEVWLRIVAVCVIPLLLLLLPIKRIKKATVITVCISVAVAFLCSFLYFDLWYFPASRYDGQVLVRGTVYEIDEETPSMLIKSESLNDSPLSGYNLLISVEEKDTISFELGDKVELYATLLISDGRGESEYRLSLISSKINALGTADGEIRLIESGEPPLESTLADLREELSRRCMALSDNDSGRLLSALLLGERDMLRASTALGFRRLGITHILALSGMHLAILSLGLTKILALLGFGKRTASILNIFFTLGYMLLTGFPVSVVRAGIMLIISSLVRLIVGCYDSPTSLLCAVFIICLFDPTAIVDVSLWLSALATMGVLTIGEYFKGIPLKKEKPRDKKWIAVLKYAGLSLITSTMAISATILLSILCFSGFSLISPISTLIISPLIEIIMYIGSVTLLIGDFIPVGALLKPISSATLWLIDAMSSANGIYVSTDYPLLRIFAVIITVGFVLLLVLKIKHKKTAIGIVAALLCGFMLTGFFVNRANMQEDDIIFADVNDSSVFVVKSQGHASLIYSDTYSSTSAYSPISILSDERICELDALVFTHYSFGVPRVLDDLTAGYELKRIILPNPRCREERTILSMIEKRAEDFGFRIEYFESREEVLLGSVGMVLNHSTVYATDTIRVAFTLIDGESKSVYLSSGMLLDDYYKYSLGLVADKETVILGSHGKSYKEPIYTNYIFKSARAVILCSDKLFIHQDAIEKYTKYGCKIYSHPYKISIKN